MTRKRTRTIMTQAVVVMACRSLTASSANAEVIYVETFDGDGSVALDGLAPTEGEGVRSISPLLNNDGTKPSPIGNFYGTVEYMVGTLDEVTIYNGVLSEAEVASLAGRTMPIYKPF